MSKRVFDLRGVGTEEADSVRELLRSNDIAFYETPRAKFGFGAEAIWLNDRNQFFRARQLIDKYQAQREKDAANRANTKQENLVAMWSKAKRNPLMALAFLAVLLFVVALSVLPVLWALRL